MKKVLDGLPEGRPQGFKLAGKTRKHWDLERADG
jgi:hypothetical protein